MERRGQDLCCDLTRKELSFDFDTGISYKLWRKNVKCLMIWEHAEKRSHVHEASKKKDRIKDGASENTLVFPLQPFGKATRLDRNANMVGGAQRLTPSPARTWSLWAGSEEVLCGTSKLADNREGSAGVTLAVPPSPKTTGPQLA